MDWTPPQICEPILAGVIVGLINRCILDGTCCGQCVALGGDSEDDSEESSTSLATSEAGVIVADVSDGSYHHVAPS